MTSARIESRLVAAERKLAAATGNANQVVVFAGADMNETELAALVDARKREHPAGTPPVIVRFVRARDGKREI